MYIMYVDESGDPGTTGYATDHFILSGLIVNQDDWDKFLERLKNFRKSIKKNYGLNQRTEIHTAELIRFKKLKEYRLIRKSDRMRIIKDYCAQMPMIFDTAKIVNVCIDKKEHVGKDIFNLAWNRILQRFDNFLKKSGGNDKGIIVADDTNSTKLRLLQRGMRVYNPVPSQYQGYTTPIIDNIIEDSFMRDSQHSYFIQSVDLVAHMLYRREYPKGSLRKFGMEYQFDKLEPILLKEASRYDPYGIVRK